MNTKAPMLRSLCLLAILAALIAPRAAAADKDIVETALAAGNFKTLATALTKAELVDALRGDGPFTVFAPTDEAFAKLPSDTLASLLDPANRAKLTSILTYHVVAGAVSSTDALAAKNAETLQGAGVTIALKGGRLNINDSVVIANDIKCSNGVIHVIDTVLLPPEPKGRKVIGVYVDHASAALRAQLQLPKSSGLVVTRLVDDGNAKKVGVKQYDVIRTINGRPATQKALDTAKEERGFGGLVDLTLVRQGKPIHIQVPVGVAN